MFESKGWSDRQRRRGICVGLKTNALGVGYELTTLQTGHGKRVRKVLILKRRFCGVPHPPVLAKRGCKLLKTKGGRVRRESKRRQVYERKGDS